MTTPDPDPTAVQRQRRRVYLLSLCQALFLTCAVASVSVAAIVGADLAPEPWMATLPYGLQFAIVIVCAYPVSRLMSRIGRKPVFALGAGCAIAAGLVGYHAIESGSFAGLIVSHLALGMFIAHANYYRFAATDGLSGPLRARAVSLVTAGGVLAGLLAPALTMEAGTASGTVGFANSYLLFCVAGLLTLLLLALVPAAPSVQRSPRHVAGEANSPVADGENRRPIDRFGFLVAVYCAGVGYLVMNLLMVQSTLVLNVDHVSYHVIGVAIQLHVVCMFLPSFFTGGLIERFGHGSVLTAGFLLLAASAAVGLLGHGVGEIIASLVLLGVAWNFLFVGGTALLTLCHDTAAAGRVQGINDTVVSALAAVGALLAGALFHLIGWSGSLLFALPAVAIGLLMVARLAGRDAARVQSA